MGHKFASTADLAAGAGISRVSAWRACRDNPGFAVRVGSAYRIPAEHLDRIARGETPAAIAAEVRAGGAASAK
jgi:hypothetical protein